MFKIKRFFLNIFGVVLAFVFSNRGFAQGATIMPMYGIVDQPPQSSITPSPPITPLSQLTPLDWAWWTLEKIFLYVTLPLVLVVVLVVGVIVFIKRKKRKKRAEKSSKTR